LEVPLLQAGQPGGGLHRGAAPIRLDPGKKLRRAFKPNYAYGCKRPTLSNIHYRTFNKPNVYL